MSINRILLSLSGIQLLIIGGIGYGLYRAGRMAEREYGKIRTEANAILQDAPDLVNQLKSITPTINTLQGDVSTALQTLQRIDRRI